METLLHDTRLLAWPSGPEKIEIEHSQGSLLYDSEGKSYVDFIMGWCVGNFGWGNQEISDAIKNFSGPAYVYPSFIYQPWLELAKLLGDICPGKLEKCFRTTGGTDSVETAMKIAMLYTKRDKFLSVEGCYHGNSFGALSIGNSHNRAIFRNLLPDCYKIDRPLDESCLETVEEILKEEEIAAFIFEPILTHPGIHIPHEKFMEGVQKLCKKYGTLLVMDEVATGFGRTGKIFASEHFGLEPDILCLAKSISGGYAAIGAAVTTRRIGEAAEGKISGPTYGWHPVSTEASIASIRYLMNHREDVLGNVSVISDLFRNRIADMNFKEGFRINMKGLAISVDVGQSHYAKKIAEKSLSEGLLIEYNGSNLMMFPALNLDENTANQGLDILENCL